MWVTLAAGMCRYGSADVVELLLDAGCSPNLTNSELLTPLHIAAKKGFPDVAEQLVQADAIDLVGGSMVTDFESACGSVCGLSCNVCVSVIHVWIGGRVVKI